jgi:hypothetical protein
MTKSDDTSAAAETRQQALERLSANIDEWTAALNRRDAEYWHALGKFIHIFAETEYWLFAYIEKAAEMPDGLARLIGAGWRTGNMLEFVRKFWELRPLQEPESTPLRSSMDQLGLILKLRNQLVHHLTFREPLAETGLRISSDAARLPPSRTPISLRVDANTLTSATSDLLSIGVQLTTAFFALDRPSAERSGMFRSFPIPDAWLYKPDQVHQQKPQKQAPQSRSNEVPRDTLPSA